MKGGCAACSRPRTGASRGNGAAKLGVGARDSTLPRRAGDRPLHPTSLADLSQIVSRADHDEIVLVLRRLADVLHGVELRKWTNAGGSRQTRPFAGDSDVRPFFFGEGGEAQGFEVRLTQYVVPFLP